MSYFSLGRDFLTTQNLFQTVQNDPVKKTISHLRINEETLLRIQKMRSYVDEVCSSDLTVYGINTGFGLLSNVKISFEDLHKLQTNLVRSHACGVGKPISSEQSRALLFLKLHNLCIGNSGVSIELVERLLNLFSAGVAPHIPKSGSVGASGDLAPLSHLALVLMGEGAVLDQKNFKQPSLPILKKLGIEPYQLKAKEGLSLINGTQFMAVLSAFAVEEAYRLFDAAQIISALSLQALRGSLKPFDEAVHLIRPHLSQIQVARNFRGFFEENDPIQESHKGCNRVQDPYSFRCIPQVHGASLSTFSYVEDIVNTELNSVSDNPIITDDGRFISGGNFHGQPLALAMDFLGIAMSEIGGISQCRIEKLINPALSGLPPFLVSNSGLNSGYMIPQVVAAALASENKILSHPASVDTIPTSADKEDHVSMGPIGCHKALRINQNVCKILAIELLASAQGIDLIKPLKPVGVLADLYQELRRMVPFSEEDVSLSDSIEMVADWIIKGGVEELLKKKGKNFDRTLMKKALEDPFAKEQILPELQLSNA